MTRFESRSVWWSGAATAVTGLAFLWAKYLAQPVDAWSVVNHPLEPWFLKAHIVVSPFFVFALGLILTRHVVPHLKNGLKRGRASGLLMIWTLVPMVVTGYLIQVVTDPFVMRLLVAAHVVTGCGFAAGLLVHGATLAARRVRPSSRNMDRPDFSEAP